MTQKKAVEINIAFMIQANTSLLTGKLVRVLSRFHALYMVTN